MALQAFRTSVAQRGVGRTPTAARGDGRLDCNRIHGRMRMVRRQPFHEQLQQVLIVHNIAHLHHKGDETSKRFESQHRALYVTSGRSSHFPNLEPYASW